MSSITRHRRRPSADTALKAAAATVGLVGLVTACGGTDKANGTGVAAQATTTAAPTTAAPTTAAPTTAAGSGAAPAAAPSGAQQLQEAAANGATYWRYSIAGTTAAQVVADYQTELQSAGYSVTNQGGGGGGWGKWGGSGAGLSGRQGGTYVSVQAGGQTGQPTYFEVCVGPSSTSVQDCENVSQGPDQQNQQNQQNQNDSNSGAS